MQRMRPALEPLCLKHPLTSWLPTRRSRARRRRSGVCVVIPVLNEEELIGGVIARIPRDAVSEIIVADGGSTDRTIEIVSAHGARVLCVGKGYGRACLAGALAADEACAIIVTMDGDGSDAPEEIPGSLRRLQQECATSSLPRAHAASANRAPWHGISLLSGWLIGAAIGTLYGFRYTDMCAFRAIRRDALIALGMREMTYGWNLEMQMKAALKRLRILEIPVPYSRRAGGRSKVAGTFYGSLRAGSRILLTLGRVALRLGRLLSHVAYQIRTISIIRTLCL